MPLSGCRQARPRDPPGGCDCRGHAYLPPERTQERIEGIEEAIFAGTEGAAADLFRLPKELLRLFPPSDWQYGFILVVAFLGCMVAWGFIHSKLLRWI